MYFRLYWRRVLPYLCTFIFREKEPIFMRKFFTFFMAPFSPDWTMKFAPSFTLRQAAVICQRQIFINSQIARDWLRVM